MTLTTGDWADHYSQSAIYMRLNGILPPSALLAQAWASMILGGLVGLAITFGLMMLLRVTEIKPVTRRLLRLAGRR